MDRKQVLGEIAQNGGGPFRPEGPPERGRGEPRTDEEIVEFMSDCVQSRWAEGVAGGIRDYLNIRATPETKMRAGEIECSGVISKPIVAGQTRMDILEVWRDSSEREQMIEEGF